MGDLGNGGHVHDNVGPVAHGLNVDGLGLLVDGGRNGLGLVVVEEVAGSGLLYESQFCGTRGAGDTHVAMMLSPARRPLASRVDSPGHSR